MFFFLIVLTPSVALFILILLFTCCAVDYVHVGGGQVKCLNDAFLTFVLLATYSMVFICYLWSVSMVFFSVQRRDVYNVQI